VALLPGWEVSPGVRLEFATLTAVGIPARPVADWPPVAPGRRPFIGVDPATGVMVTGYFEGGALRVEQVENLPGQEAPATWGEARAVSTCRLCGERVVWTGREWRAECGGDWSAVC